MSDHSFRFSFIAFIMIAVFTITQVCAKEGSTFADTHKPLHAPYLNVGKKEYMIAFYGYVGCTHVCMPILENLKNFYTSKEFAPYQEKVDVVFINLLPKIDKELPDQFAKTYHQDFYGVHLSEQELSKLDKELQLFFTKNTDESFDIDHSDHLYLIERLPNGTLGMINMYTTHPLIKEYILNDLAKHKQK